MKKPLPKDYGCKGGFNDWPDKESKQRYQAAMAEYQRFIYSKMTPEQKGCDELDNEILGDLINLYKDK